MGVAMHAMQPAQHPCAQELPRQGSESLAGMVGNIYKNVKRIFSMYEHPESGEARLHVVIRPHNLWNLVWFDSVPLRSPLLLTSKGR